MFEKKIGQGWTLRIFQRRSTSEVPQSDQLVKGERIVEINKLTRSQAKYLPNAYQHATKEQWQSLLTILDQRV